MRKQEIVLGAIVFTVLVATVLSVVWLSENYAGPDGGYKLNVRFDSVIGLNQGNAVTLRGVRVGKVLDIEIDEEGYPLVQIGFRPPLSDLPTDTRVVMKSLGMLGEQMIEVHIGSSAQTLPDGAFVRGEAAPGLEQLTMDAATMAGDVRSAVDTILTPGNIRHMRSTISRLDSAITAVNATVLESRTAIEKTVAHASSAAEEADRLVAENSPDVEVSVDKLREASERLAATSARLEEAGGSLQAVLANLDRLTEGLVEGKGTLGRLLVDDSLYESLRSSAASVDSLVSDIQQNPGRYFHVSVF